MRAGTPVYIYKVIGYICTVHKYIGKYRYIVKTLETVAIVEII